jgi:hypothetical protein
LSIAISPITFSALIRQGETGETFLAPGFTSGLIPGNVAYAVLPTSCEFGTLAVQTSSLVSSVTGLGYDIGVCTSVGDIGATGSMFSGLVQPGQSETSGTIERTSIPGSLLYAKITLETPFTVDTMVSLTAWFYAGPPLVISSTRVV